MINREPRHVLEKKPPPAARSRCRRTACCSAPRAACTRIGDYCFNDGRTGRAAASDPRHPETGALGEAATLGQMLISSDGTEAPIEFEPREVLARVLKRSGQGHPPGGGLRTGVLPARPQARRRPAALPRDPLTDDEDDQPNMHIERPSRFSDVLHEMVEAAQEQGVDANVITAELGPGQFEINFAHCDDGLHAADQAAQFCRSTRGVAMKNMATGPAL